MKSLDGLLVRVLCLSISVSIGAWLAGCERASNQATTTPTPSAHVPLGALIRSAGTVTYEVKRPGDSFFIVMRSAGEARRYDVQILGGGMKAGFIVHDEPASDDVTCLWEEVSDGTARIDCSTSLTSAGGIEVVRDALRAQVVREFGQSAFECEDFSSFLGSGRACLERGVLKELDFGCDQAGCMTVRAMSISDLAEQFQRPPIALTPNPITGSSSGSGEVPISELTLPSHWPANVE